MIFSVSDAGILGKGNYDLPSLDAVPLSYRRLVVARPLNWVHVINIFLILIELILTDFNVINVY